MKGRSTTDLPGVSILLVTKNGERYLAEILQRIHEQQGNFRLTEIIAVDSGSRDRTLSISQGARGLYCTDSAPDVRPRQNPQLGRLARPGRLSCLSDPRRDPGQRRLAGETAGALSG